MLNLLQTKIEDLEIQIEKMQNCLKDLDQKECAICEEWLSDGCYQYSDDTCNDCYTGWKGEKWIN